MNETQRKAVEAGIDLERLPVHIAMIMDGNGRFAQKQGFMRLWGHHQGYRTLKHVLLDCARLGIKHLTVYGFSAENWRRPEDEVGGLMKLIEEAARRETDALVNENVRARDIGRRHELPTSLQEAIHQMESRTANNTGIEFILAINYGGRAEIVDAVKTLVRQGVDPDSITEESLGKALYAPEVPEPDLIVRTAGELRWSNFLIWQAAYAELFVTPVTWPEFGLPQLIEAVAQYQKRTRKFGGLAT